MRVDARDTELRFRFGQLFGAKPKVERSTFGTYPLIELQKTVDNFENWKDIVIRYSERELTEYTTIYDFFSRLDKGIKAYDGIKKQISKNSKK